MGNCGTREESAVVTAHAQGWFLPVFSCLLSHILSSFADFLFPFIVPFTRINLNPSWRLAFCDLGLMKI